MTKSKHSGWIGIILALTASLAFEPTARAATIELNCGQPADEHLSVDLTKMTVFSQTKNDPKVYGPGSGFRGVWEPVIAYTAPAQITPRLIHWVIYSGTTPFYYDLDRTTGIETMRTPVGPYWNSSSAPCVPGTMSFPATKF